MNFTRQRALRQMKTYLYNLANRLSLQLKSKLQFMFPHSPVKCPPPSDGGKPPGAVPAI